MASISTDRTTGLRRILFYNGNGERKKIHLGKVPMKLAREIKIRVEVLAAANAHAHSIDLETAKWLGKIEDDLHAKLAATGLVPERLKADVATLRGLVDHVVGLRADAKPRTLVNLKQAGEKIIKFLGEDKPLNCITQGDVDNLIAALRQKLSPAYVARIVKYGKQFFSAARRAGLLTASPFDGVKAGTMANPKRMYFLTRDDTEKILLTCPNAEWRLIVALARFGGLRCPSELAALKWTDVDWERGRFLVRSPKTAHHSDGGLRWVPIFPELRPHLEEVFHDPERETVFVVKRKCAHDTNLRTTFERIVNRAGLIPWAKPFQNMRSTRETELAQAYPIHVVTAWIGNSASVAVKHYLQVTDADFDKATKGIAPLPVPRAPLSAPTAQNPAQSEAGKGCPEMTVVPSCEQKRLENVKTPRNPGEMERDRYARQESNL